jgi:hypothetical protein
MSLVVPHDRFSIKKRVFSWLDDAGSVAAFLAGGEMAENYGAFDQYSQHAVEVIADSIRKKKRVSGFHLPTALRNISSLALTAAS